MFVVSDHSGKRCHTFLRSRVEPFVEEQARDHQSGGRRHRGTALAIHTVHTSLWHTKARMTNTVQFTPRRQPRLWRSH